MKIFSHVSGLFRQSSENAPGPLKNASHAKKNEATSSFQNEQARDEIQNKKDRSARHRILRAFGQGTSSTTHTSPQQASNDASIHIRPHVSDRPAWTRNHASKPYPPITAHRPVHCGAQNKTSISGTEYAKQAADRLIDENGKLDRTHIHAMLDELKADAVRPPEQQMLSDFHRKHVSNTLRALLEDDKLVNIINQTCKHKPLKGTAADLVQATLNVSPQTEIGKAEARKAVVMSLLGNLRQGQVGSCFATASAISVHREAPRVVASELKELLENNSMTMKSGNAKTQVPLNKHISLAAAQVKLQVRSDGACFGKAGGTQEDPHWLHETPGMAAALSALGIPEQHRYYYVTMALQRLNVQGNGLQDISPQQVIECLAHGTDGKGLRPEQRIAAALDAFSGTEDVRLLRAWEYTLATHASSPSHNNDMQFIAAAVLNPAGEAGGNQFAQDLSSSPGFQSAPVLQLRQELLNDVVHLIKQRLHLQYDADVEQQNISGDGVSVHGGQVLYDRVPPNDPTQWQRIDNPEMFQAAMAHLVEEAAQNTRRKAASMGGKTAVNQQAVRYLADHLKQHIGNPDFANQTAIRFNAYKGKGNAVDPFNLPWKRVSGEFPMAVMGHYGSTFLSASNISPVNSDGVAADGNNSTQTGKPDASTMLYSVLNAQVSMSTELQSKAKAQKSEFYAPLWNEGAKHVYSVIPTEMAEVWRHDDPTKNLTPQQWVDKHLVQPAQAYLDQKRTTPQLHGLLKSICVPMNLPAVDMDRIYRNISAKSEFRGGQQVYNLRDVHEALSQQCARYANADQWRDWMQTELAHQVPPSPGMTKRIGDTNWEDAKGSPTYLGVKHNPFTNKIEANFIDDKGNITGGVAENWLFGKQFLGTPLAQRNS